MNLAGNRCQCSECGEYFNRVSTFDKHRTGSFEGKRRCLTSSFMAEKGWLKNSAGFWITGKSSWRKES